jgi:hypothetical protein
LSLLVAAKRFWCYLHKIEEVGTVDFGRQIRDIDKADTQSDRVYS